VAAAHAALVAHTHYAERRQRALIKALRQRPALDR
jgi:hypothetical protein